MRILITLTLLFTCLVSTAQVASESKSASADVSEFIASDWLVEMPVYPQAIFSPAELKFAKPFTGKVQILTLEGREILHAELEMKENLLLPPSGLSGEYILRLIDLETNTIIHSQKTLFK